MDQGALIAHSDALLASIDDRADDFGEVSRLKWAYSAHQSGTGLPGRTVATRAGRPVAGGDRRPQGVVDRAGSVRSSNEWREPTEGSLDMDASRVALSEEDRAPAGWRTLGAEQARGVAIDGIRAFARNDQRTRRSSHLGGLNRTRRLGTFVTRPRKSRVWWGLPDAPAPVCY
jgi:hypothetical protein